jgi:hypothetical protein
MRMATLAKKIQNGKIGGIGSVKAAIESAPSIFATQDTPALSQLTVALSKDLDSVGLAHEVRIFDFGGFKNTIIPKRSFNLLVFGQRYRHYSDAYAYWNSNERTDPGLNITETISPDIDQLTETLLKQTEHSKSEHAIPYTNLKKAIGNQKVFLPLYLNRDFYIFRKNHAPIKKLLYDYTIALTQYHLGTLKHLLTYH